MFDDPRNTEIGKVLCIMFLLPFIDVQFIHLISCVHSVFHFSLTALIYCLCFLWSCTPILSFIHDVDLSPNTYSEFLFFFLFLKGGSA